jgi:ATP-dependent Clp protease ATP-binding subunit ClpB
MTSNIGSQHLADYNGGEGYEGIQKTVMAELRNYFRPEFINRVDEIVVFHSLTREHLVGIVKIQLKHFTDRLNTNHIGLRTEPQAEALIAEKGFDPVYGARPLKRIIQKELETPISRMLISGEIKEGDMVIISTDQNRFIFNVSQK